MKTRLMTHLVAYYPNRDASLRTAKAFIDGGSSFLEVQFPFSDPIADGVYIQHACKQALDQGFKLIPGFELLALIKGLAPDIPLFVMSYGNIAYRFGIGNFLDKCKEAGAQGVIIPDLPPDYDEGLFAAGKKCNLQVIPVIAPGISNSRLKIIAETGAEYLYACLRKGITGAATEIGKENLDFLNRIKPLAMKVLAGFGIAERKQVEILSPYVHAAVIGSAFIKEIMNNGEGKDPYKVILAKMKRLIPEDERG